MPAQNAYSKRSSLSGVPAPIELDSDSDFNPGTYIPEPKKKKQKTKTTVAGPSRKRRRADALEDPGSSPKRRKRVRSVGITDPNPLQKYFGDDLDLHSESEGEDSDVPNFAKSHSESEAEESDGDERKRYLAARKAKASKPRTLPSSNPSAKPIVVADDDDSVTEPESDPGLPSLRSIPQPSGSKSTAPLKNSTIPPSNADDSVTESETEPETESETEPESDEDMGKISIHGTAQKVLQKPNPPANEPNSETESESEPEELKNVKLRPRPGFPLAPNQRPGEALVLDEEQGIKIPVPINTYLRDYQRDGVKFLWRQYNQECGGLLGDDMGLDFKLGRLDVVITTFDLARREINLLDDLAWSCIIVDEVHRVKNEAAKITLAYHQFKCLRRFGLTGTTIQNSYKEMWTILDWTNPDKLGTVKQWNGYVVKPLTMGQSASATEEERAKALVVAVILRDKILPEFFLRRTKDIIKDQLPQKTDQVAFCPLTDRQIAAYKHLLNMEPLQNLVNRDKPCPCGSHQSRKSCCHPFVVGDVFKFMSILIKLSNHLGLILPGPSDTAEQTARNRALAEIAFPDGNIPKYGTAMMQPQYCGKWGALEVLLKEWRKDKSNKVLIFTKSVKLLEMLEFHLGTKGYGFLKLDGSTKQVDRMPMIDQFNHDPDVYVFLISTLAGGTGLNLTGANKVVIFDPNWNPAHDLQAMDRAFRFGQTRDVAVYRLLGAGSVEELIYARQIYKQQQMAIGYDASVQTRYFQGIQGDNAKKGELFGIENIFKLHEDKLATKMAIEKANLAELDWALANLDGGPRGKKSAKPANELVEADAKIGKEEGNLKGLGALLFDDAPPPTVPREQDIIQKTLNAIGVTYSHMNDEILVPSKIEAERTKRSLLNVRKRKSKGAEKEKEKEPSPQFQWPPKRRHHKPQPTPEQQLASRHKALIRLGMINSPDDVSNFAHEFARQSPDAQRKIIAELDQWAAEHPMSSDSD
ncbi:unnamed protein product [Cyclocybe aegerita]|uniref:Uncharacterized protein n=1 Tax=Cyclocybe aegerita TaxID=1973307 RepID=A0A8S0WZC9_CYCAE|nr:unnamed protein product [Cyclocybe aegerita]